MRALDVARFRFDSQIRLLVCMVLGFAPFTLVPLAEGAGPVRLSLHKTTLRISFADYCRLSTLGNVTVTNFSMQMVSTLLAADIMPNEHKLLRCSFMHSSICLILKLHSQSPLGSAASKLLYRITQSDAEFQLNASFQSTSRSCYDIVATCDNSLRPCSSFHSYGKFT